MLNIVIFGAPGSGKGTQSAKLIEKYGLKHVSTGDLLRAEIKANSPLGQLAESYMSKGQLVPDEVVIGMVANKINDILNNPELALETGKKASEFIRSHASVGVSAQGFVKAIDN